MNNLNGGRAHHLTSSLEPRYLLWTNMKSLNKEIEQTMLSEEDLLIIEGVTRATLSRMLSGSEPNMRITHPVRIRRYYAEEQRLILNVVNDYQTQISESIDLMIRTAIKPSYKPEFNLEQLDFSSSSEIQIPMDDVFEKNRKWDKGWIQHNPLINQTNDGESFIRNRDPVTVYKGGDLGQADIARRPVRAGKDSDWPTLVIESGYTTHEDQLRKEMPWWFKASNHAVKIVLLAKVNCRRKSLVIEQWEEDDEMIARDSTRFIPVKRNTVSVRIVGEFGGQGQMSQYQVEGDPLVLKFRKLFDRDPVGDDDKHDKDAVIKADDLLFVGQMLLSLWR